MKQATKMRLMMCVVVFLSCAGSIAPSLYTPTVISAIEIHIDPHLSKKDLASHTARMKSFVDGVSTFLMFFILPLSGVLSDKHGRKPIVVASLLSSILGSLVMMASDHFLSLWMLFVSKVVGAGVAFVTYTGSAYVNDMCEVDSDRAKNFGMITGSYGAGMVVMPLMLSAVSTYGIPVALFVAAGISFLTLLIVLLFLKESLHYDAQNVSKSARSINTYSQQEEKSNLSFLQQISPFRSWGTVLTSTNPYVTTLAIVYIFYGFAISDVIDTAIIYTNVRFGWTASDYALCMSYLGVILVVYQLFLLGFLVKAAGEHRLMCICLFVDAIVRMGYILSFNQWMYLVIAGLGYLTSAVGPTLTALVTRKVAKEDVGAAISALGSLFSLCQFLGALAMENIFAYFISSNAIVYFPGAHFVISCVMLLTAAIISTALYFKHKPSGVVIVQTDETTPILNHSGAA